MAATAYGIGTQEWKSRPDFNARRDATGAWTASNSFTMLREVWENYAQDQFVKGTTITELYEELPAYWGFLTLDQVEVANEAGGITLVRCEWVGVKEPEEGDEDEDQEETSDEVYTLSGTRVDRSILEHPLFIKEIRDNENLDSKNKAAVTGAYNGKWQTQTARVNDHTNYTIVSTSDMGTELNISELEVIKWIRVILEQGIKTFKAPTLQWTVEKTSKQGWKDADLEHLGKVEFNKANRPPGEPPMPVKGEYEWLKVTMNQTRTNGQTRQSQSWELSQTGGFHRFPEPDQDEGIYNYDLDGAGE